MYSSNLAQKGSLDAKSEATDSPGERLRAGGEVALSVFLESPETGEDGTGADCAGVPAVDTFIVPDPEETFIAPVPPFILIVVFELVGA